jgi:hypothetical protein
MFQEGGGLLPPDLGPFAVDDRQEGVDVGGTEAAQEVAGGGRVGDTLGAEGVEVRLVVTQQFEVLDSLAAGQEVVSEVEDVVGLEVGQVAFEQVEFVVEGVGQAEALDEELAGADASGVQATGLVADVVVDVAVPEHPPALFSPLLLAQAAADAALAMAESPLYLDVHLKYLRAGGKGNRLHTPIPPGMPRYFKFFHACLPSRRGGHACFGPSGSSIFI